MSEIKEEVIGKWPGIFASLGIEVGDGRHIDSCPLCGGKKKFRMDDQDGQGTWICTCGAGDGWALLTKKLGIDFKEAIKTVKGIVGSVSPLPRQEEPKMTREQFKEIIKGMKKITPSDPVGKYLRNRGLTKIPQFLWYHPAMWENETKQKQKAMVGVFYDTHGSGLSMHRTYLTAAGDKMKIESPKKLMPCLGRLNGGAIRLWPAAETMGIAEGIETAIAASEDCGCPVWASYSANMMADFEPPPECKTLLIFADNDKNYTGQKSAYALANRIIIQPKYDINVHVYIPEIPGHDWLDVVAKNKLCH